MIRNQIWFYSAQNYQTWHSTSTKSVHMFHKNMCRCEVSTRQRTNVAVTHAGCTRCAISYQNVIYLSHTLHFSWNLGSRELIELLSWVECSQAESLEWKKKKSFVWPHFFSMFERKQRCRDRAKWHDRWALLSFRVKSSSTRQNLISLLHPLRRLRRRAKKPFNLNHTHHKRKC